MPAHDGKAERRGICTVSCEGCNESWTWCRGDVNVATFSEWYLMLDEILTAHVIAYPLCWSNWTRRPR